MCVEFASESESRSTSPAVEATGFRCEPLDSSAVGASCGSTFSGAGVHLPPSFDELELVELVDGPDELDESLDSTMVVASANSSTSTKK